MGFLKRFRLEDRSLLSRAPFGVQAHNIRALGDGVLMTCSSADGALVATDGWRMEVGGFPLS